MDLKIESTITGAGLSLVSRITRAGDAALCHDVTLPAGKPGTLTTRSTASDGIITLGSGHGVTTSDLVDLYWAGGIYPNVMVSAVTSTTITVTASGLTLPAQGTAMVVGVRTEIESGFDGDGLAGIVVLADARACVDFLTATPASLRCQELAAGEDWRWVSGQPPLDYPAEPDNPLAGNPVATIAASAGTAVATRLQILAVRDSTP